MKRALRALAFGVGALAMLAALGLSLVYVATEPMVRRTYDRSLRPVVLPADADSIAEGRRLALIRGCFDGCHGSAASGAEFWIEPWMARLIAPDLTRAVAGMSDSELERVIRRGVRMDGTSTWGMPSSMFYHLTDDDLGRILAFLRALPASDGPETEIRIGLLWRRQLLQDRLLPYAEEIARDAPWLTETDRASEHGHGRYLALTVCSECHGMDLRGAQDGTAPDLVVAAAYTQDQFAQLMKTGEPIGERQLDLMALVARGRFSHFTDDEVRDLYGYLIARSRGTP